MLFCSMSPSRGEVYGGLCTRPSPPEAQFRKLEIIFLPNDLLNKDGVRYKFEYYVSVNSLHQYYDKANI